MPRKPREAPETRWIAAPIDAVVHRKDRRPNIPTAELADFAVKEERAPYTLRYPRDPSLDPQLVWKGKDEQDGQALEVPSVPIYIQEHISPQAIVEDLRRQKKEGAPRQASLFADFDGLDLSDRVDFYHHSQNWTNRMILGDSLLVMASLAEKEGLKGQVQMIYLDPPYGIKFGSNWQVSTRKRDVRDGKVEDATREPEQIKAFRDTWKLGIHSYLAYWRDRLVMAKELLTETGSIFVQIGDENVHLVRCMMDEVFGSENFISQISFVKTTGFSGNYLSNVSDYLVWYGKDASQTKFRQIYKQKEAGEIGATAYHPISEFPVDRGFWKDGDLTRLGTSADLTSQGASTASEQRIAFAGRAFLPPVGLHWKTTVDGLKRLIASGRIFLVGNTLRYLRLLDDFNVYPLSSTWTDTGIAGFTADKVYVVQTLPKVIERCLLITTHPGDLVLDPTCGSGTTAYVAERWGRRWITVDTSRVAIALARTRVMSARFPYYVLADTPEGIQKEADLAGRPAPWPLPPTERDIKKGFVYKRVPHVTLKSIANNPDIKEGMTREEIDAAIARNADIETLCDQPYENNKVVRVTGPFTVESLSPHRVLALEEDRPRSEDAVAKDAGPGQFETMILENLRKAGVQNTVKDQRLRFDRLEPYAGLYLHAEGEYEENSQAKRVAICIGPEHGTVGPELVKEAAKEAVRGAGFDLLVVCGFAFDPYVSEETRQYGKLTVLTAKINPDLKMGDEFLKKTGAGNLFMVFGEPDVEVVSDQWIVDRNGRRVVSCEQFKIVSGIDGLAEISGLGREDISGNSELSKGGNLRTGQPDAKGGYLDSLEHSRRAIEELHRRISAVSGHQQGKSGRTGDANRSGRKTEIFDASTTGDPSARLHGNRQDVERLDAVTALTSLTADHLPLTTDHSIIVEIKGVDVYDPTTGQIRSHSTDDIACWFIDTDYNEECFFVRKAYFCGGDEPYDKLKRALKAEIDEAAWAALYRTKSRPFDPPKTGRIAVKVINHYGDEVLKVYKV